MKTMSEDTKDLLNDLGFEFLSMENVHHKPTCLLDLSDGIILEICRYLPPSHILYSFYTPSTANFRLHRIILNYYQNIKLDKITNNQYLYFSSLFCLTIKSFPLESLILSNRHVNCLIQRYFTHTIVNVNESLFFNLKRLTLIDCSAENLPTIDFLIINLTQLEYLSITIRKCDQEEVVNCFQTSNAFINKLLFNGQLRSINTASIELNDGILLTKSLISHNTLTNINLVLRTIDDLHVLLGGLVPNVQTMIIQLCQSRILSCSHPQITPSCPQLTQFSLLEPRIGLIIDDIKSILGYMPNLIRLTLSIRDTSDPTFIHGPKFESILFENVPHLRQFNYTITHRIVNQSLIEDFIQWPMNVVYYENENCTWIHIYSLPWPSNKDDKRRLPIVKGGCNASVRSDVKRAEYIDHLIITKSDEFLLLNKQFRRVCQITTCLSIDIKLPERISKVILSKKTPIFSINSVIQSSIDHLIVQRRLTNENEISNLARQFPSVQYLDLLLPLNESSYIRCLKRIFTQDDNIQNKTWLWPQLINFSTGLVYGQLESIWTDSKLYDWFIENTDLKYHEYPFHVHYSFTKISIWF